MLYLPLQLFSSGDVRIHSFVDRNGGLQGQRQSVYRPGGRGSEYAETRTEKQRSASCNRTDISPPDASLNDHSFSSRASTLQPVTSPDGSRQLGEIENVSVNTLGFTELATGGERPFLDIVLVHGLQGHPRTTWEYKGKHPAQELGQGQEEESKTRKLWDFFKGRKKIKREYTNFWPETNLSKDFPEARIMTFGYDSHIAQRDGPVNLTNITDHGGALLNGLRYRRKKEPDRPMLFLAHSLGGLIVKSVSAP